MPWSAPGLERVIRCRRLRLLQLLFQSIDEIVQPACDQPRSTLQNLEEIFEGMQGILPHQPALVV